MLKHHLTKTRASVFPGALSFIKKGVYLVLIKIKIIDIGPKIYKVAV